MTQVYVRLPKSIMRSKGLASAELVAEPQRWTERGLYVAGHALVEATDVCRRCGKEIKNPISRLVGFGPDCCDALGIPRDFPPELIEQVRQQAMHHSRFEGWMPRKFCYADPNYTVLWQPPADAVGGPAPDVKEHVLKIEVVDDTHLGVHLMPSFPRFTEIKDAVKALPGSRWDKEERRWNTPLENGPALAEIIRDLPNVVIDADTPWLDRAKKVIARKNAIVAASKRAEAELEVPGLNPALSLFPYQMAGVKYAAWAKRCYIADQMGLGKTVESLATVQYLDSYPAVFVVPGGAVKLNWERELRKWLPGRSIYMIEKRKQLIERGHDIYLINYDLVSYHVKALQFYVKPKAIVCDEAHFLKNGQAQRSKALYDLCHPKDGSEPEVILMLTGTATKNRSDELLHPLKIMGQLHRLGTEAQFIRRYVKQSNDLELNERLRSFCYVRREKRDIYTELPPKRKIAVPLELDNWAEYERAERDLIQYLEEEAELENRFLASIEHLIEADTQESIAEYYAAIRTWRADKARRAMSAEHLVKFNTLKRLTARGKLAEAKVWIQDFLDSGSKLIVFAHHTNFIHALAQHFGCDYIDGTVSSQKRLAAVDRFQNDESARLIVLNLQAGGVGLTLTAASDVAFLELPWTPADIEQAEDRCYGRVNDLHGATSWYLLAANTVEETIAELLDAKRAVTDAINIGADAEEEASIMHLLIEQMLAKGERHVTKSRMPAMPVAA